MANYDIIGYAAAKHRFDILTLDGKGCKTTGDMRKALRDIYVDELALGLNSREDGTSEREVYESFKKRHRLETMPDDIGGARELVSEKLKSMEPWLIEKIYKERYEPAYEALINASAFKHREPGEDETPRPVA